MNQFATPSQKGFDESRIPTPASKVAPANKPLPSPPIAQVLNTSPEARCLIDASEKPLRRSPPEHPDQHEDWPVLFPAKPSKPNAIRSIVQEGGLSKQSAGTVETQPYPKILDASGPPGLKPLNSEVSIESISRKPVEKAKQVEVTNTKLLHSNKDNDNGKVSRSKDPSPTDQGMAGMSAADAAVQKRSDESRNLSHPRQTKTSSLRARISNGSITKDRPSSGNEVIGFTDFTTIVESSSLATRAGSRSSKASSEALNGRRAPAAIIAGSRRPITHRPHRPTSQTSLRSFSRASDLPSEGNPSSRLKSVLPSGELGDVVVTTTSNAESRRSSSIPVLRRKESLVGGASQGTSVDTMGLPEKVKRSSRKAFDIFEEPIVESPDSNKGRSAPELGMKDGGKSSTAHAYTIKRLSMTSPEYGPTLRVSSSAERVIMGEDDTDKENHPKVRANKSRDLRRQVAVNELHKSTQDTVDLDAKKRLSRSFSSQSLSHCILPTGLPADKHVQEEAARGTDKDYFLPTDHLQHHSGLSRSYVSRTNTNSCGNDDPFFDARSYIVDPEADCKHALMPEADSKSGVNPVVRRASSIALSDSIPLNPGFLPAIMQEHAGKDKGLPTNESNLQPVSTPQQQKEETSGHPAGSFPPRSSSRAAVPDFTISSVSPHQSDTRLSDEFAIRQNKLGESFGMKTSQLDYAGSLKRDSVAHSSNKSQGSMSKGMLSNFRGLFHKRSGENGVKQDKPKLHITKNGSPFPPMSEIHPIHRPTLASTSRSKRPAAKLDIPSQPLLTPAYQSPGPSELATTTTLAMEILDLARMEPSSPKKERYFELGKILVEAVTQARDAEKFAEEAKQSARRAEVSYILCAKSVSDIAKNVQEWKALMDLDA
ncbi:MAG: hypothetical protein Q9187_001430 [Circinaria calcarea]